MGSVLGPLLFSIYINGLTELPVSSPSSLILYADDILLSHVIPSPSCMASVQSDLDLIAHWINSHLLSLNPNKCKYMVISRNSSSFTSSLPSLSLAGVSLEQVQLFKYLGVVISNSSRLSWSDHVLHVAAKARKSIGVIYHNFYRHSSPATLLQLYKSIVLPQLTYCSSVWAPSSSSGSMCKLESVQHFALKVCLHPTTVIASMQFTFHLFLLDMLLQN